MMMAMTTKVKKKRIKLEIKNITVLVIIHLNNKQINN
jgi:hypothetical protein